MKKLYEFSTQELFKLEYECPCGEKHVADSPEVYTESAEEAVKNTLPSGHVLIISAEDVEQRGTDKLEKKLVESGYRVSRLNLLPFESVAYTADVPDDVRLIFAYGGSALIEFSKRLAFERKIKFVAAPLSMNYTCALSATARIRADGNILETEAKRADALYIDYEALGRVGEEVLAAAYGRVFSKLAACFDYYFAGKVRGEKYCPEIMNAVIRSVTRLLYSDGDVRSLYNIKLLSDTALRIALFEQMSSELSGGEYQLCSAIERFLYTETRDKRLFGENMFLSSVVVCGLYASFLAAPVPCAPPPDRSRSVVGMRKILELPDTYTLSFMRGYGSNMSVDEFKLGLYRRELSDMVKKINLLLKEGLYLVRRVYSDAGFFMKYYLAAEEVYRLLSLAPDYVSRPTLLSLAKDSGILEKYAV